MITIRPLTTHNEIFAVEQLQRDAWGVPDIDVVPLHMLITPPRHGGLLLGAFDGERLAGFVFGFLGLTADGRLKHCSHMAGVHPDYRDHGVGYSLKLAQREHVLAQGLDLITWTFDPLETRNAALNFHKLGAVCNTYIRNLYGAMRAAINAGPPSDRFEVAWWIRSACKQAARHPPHPPLRPPPPPHSLFPFVVVFRASLPTTRPPGPPMPPRSCSKSPPTSRPSNTATCPWPCSGACAPASSSRTPSAGATLSPTSCATTTAATTCWNACRPNSLSINHSPIHH